jgi:para-aminobenzoate synthetase component 1
LPLLASPGPLVQRLGDAPDLLEVARSGTGLRQCLTVGGWTLALSDPLLVVRDLPTLSGLATALGWREPVPGGPPFAGGLAGLISDDLSRGLLGLPLDDARPLLAPVPPLCFGLYDSAVCADPEGRAWVVAADLGGLSRRPASARLEELRARVGAAPPRRAAPAVAVARRATASLTREAHARSIERILGWIAAGDLYQLNLTLQLSAPCADGGAALARRLWQASPGAAHAAWLLLENGTEIVSASPETFLRVEGDTVAVRPIKGTRPRDADEAADKAQGDALLASAKDRAEHVMIVDLERNDLGRVCDPGSVRVPEFAALEAHPTVWHLTSTVEGRLAESADLRELIAATFPCGSVTGAPKRMAVERTARVEPVRRGVYCGAIGLVSRGRVDLSVAIRTAVVADGIAHYGAGGGIVADSEPSDEWQEALHKAEAFFAAVGARPE